MCFSVMINIDMLEMSKKFDINFDLPKDYYKYSPVGYTKKDLVPVVYQNQEGEVVLQEMIWSLVPPWAKEFPLKWNTYNARMERDKDGEKQKIYQVPSFKHAFKKKQFCLIPINAAIESCYWGGAAGTISAFSREDEAGFFVLGLYDVYQDKKTFTMLTDGPYEYFFQNGHDRSIIAYNYSSFTELINNQQSDEDLFQAIRLQRRNQLWKFKKIRDLKSGWEKHVPKDEEMQEIRSTVF